MLSFKNRLNNEKEIGALLRSGSRFSTPSVILVFGKPSLSPTARFGFVVSKKVSNKTTKRNLVKRRMRAVIAKYLSEVRVGADYLFLARPKIANLSYEEILKDMIYLLERARAIKPMAKK